MVRLTVSSVRRKAAARFLYGALCFVSAVFATAPRGATKDTQKPSAPTAAPQSDTASTAPCDTTAQRELTLACEYTLSAESASPRIAINRLSVSFQPKHESHMTLELTFTNMASTTLTEGRTVYFAIDDQAGQNHVRRPLPHVDFRALEPSKATTFTEHILMPAFQPGRYIINLWIPSNDPSVKFDPAHNLLLASDTVPNKKTGLNQLATFTVR